MSNENNQNSDGQFSAFEGKLPGVGILFKDTWDLYTSRFKTSFLLQLLNIAVWVVAGLVAIGLGYWLQKDPTNPGTIIISVLIGLVFVVAVIAYSIWVQGAQIFVYDLPAGEVGLQKALHKSKAFIRSLFIVIILQGLVTFGAFALLVIPGIIMSVFLVFSTYFALLDHKQGLNALLASKEYVKGYWWPVFGRIIVLILVAIGVSIVVSIFTKILDASGANGAGDILNYLVSLATAPFYVAFSYVLFKQFKTLKADIEVPNTGRSMMIGLAIFAPIAMILVIVGVVWAAQTGLLPLDKGKFIDAQGKAVPVEYRSGQSE